MAKFTDEQIKDASVKCAKLRDWAEELINLSEMVDESIDELSHCSEQSREEWEQHLTEDSDNLNNAVEAFVDFVQGIEATPIEV